MTVKILERNLTPDGVRLIVEGSHYGDTIIDGAIWRCVDVNVVPEPARSLWDAVFGPISNPPKQYRTTLRRVERAELDHEALLKKLRAHAYYPMGLGLGVDENAAPMPRYDQLSRMAITSSFYPTPSVFGYVYLSLASYSDLPDPVALTVELAGREALESL